MRSRVTLAHGVVASVAIVVAGFLAVAAYEQRLLGHIDADGAELASRVAPRIQRAAEARVAVREVRALALEHLSEADAPLTSGTIEEARAALGRAIADYRATRSDGDQSGGGDARDLALGGEARVLDEALAGVGAAVHGPAADRWRALRACNAAADALAQSLMTVVFEDVRRAELLATEMTDLRARSARVMLASQVALACAAALAVIVVLAARARHDRLRDRHTEMLAARADELQAFASRVAHDLLSPLNAASLFVATLRRRTDASSELAVIARRAERSFARAGRIVRDLLAFASAEAPGGGLCDLREVVAGVLEDVDEYAEERRVVLVLEPMPALGVACGEGVLASVASNLARNAVKFTAGRPGPRVVLRAWPCGERVHLEVEDNGPGVPDEAIPSLFEPYVRGPAADRCEGLGLGLATVRRLVSAHGGRVGVETQLGRGSTFWVELPLARRASA